MTSEPTTPPTRVRYSVMAYLGVLAFLTYFDRIFITRAAGDIQRDLSIDKEQMGLVMGAFWLAYALFELPGGWMGDRFGARVTLVRIVLGWSLFTALSGSAVGFVSLLVFRFLFGVGEAGAFPNMARVQANWLPVETRARASGMLWLMARWGGAFSPLIFGWMMRGLDSPWFRAVLGERLSGVASWRLGFWASGLLGVVWVAAFWPWFRDHPSRKKSVNAAELELITRNAPPPAEPIDGAQGKGHGMPRTMWGALMRCPSLWAMGVYYLFGSFGWSFFASWLPTYFKEARGVDFKQSELMAVGPLFFGGVSCLVGGMLCQALVRRTGWRRWGRAVFPICGATTAAVAMLCMPFVKTPMEASILLCITAAAFDFGQAANWATIVDLGGRYAGVTAGLVNLVGNMGNAIQPWSGAKIVGALGWDKLFAFYAAAYLIAACMWLFIDPRRAFYEARGSREQVSRAGLS